MNCAFLPAPMARSSFHLTALLTLVILSHSGKAGASQLSLTDFTGHYRVTGCDSLDTSEARFEKIKQVMEIDVIGSPQYSINDSAEVRISGDHHDFNLFLGAFLGVNQGADDWRLNKPQVYEKSSTHVSWTTEKELVYESSSWVKWVLPLSTTIQKSKMTLTFLNAEKTLVQLRKDGCRGDWFCFSKTQIDCTLIKQDQ